MTDPAQPSAGRPSRFLVIAVLAVVVAVGVGWAVGTLRTRRTEPTSPTPSPVAATSERRGEMLFQVHCAACHGPDGRGDGPSAAALRPPPRDFAARPWRTEPTRDAIRRVTLDGLPGGGMPAFRAALPPADLEAIVEHTFRLSTSRPPTATEPSERERLLRDAGFIDLRGADAPPLIVTDAAGQDVRLADLRGKLVLLHFWGTSCVHCLKEMPHLRALEVDLAGRGFTVLHVCTDAEDVADAQELAGRAAPGVRVFADLSGLGLARFEVQSFPTVWLVGPDGMVLGRSHGARDWTAPAVRRLIEHALPEPPRP